MSGDGPSKLAPDIARAHDVGAQQAEPLDDIILGDDDPTDAPPPVAPKPSTPPPPVQRTKLPDSASAPSAPPPPMRKDRSSSRLEAAAEAPRDAKESQGRKRAKMTLRIPDDEISRPNLPATTPVGGVPAALPPVTTPSRPPSSPEPAARAEAAEALPPRRPMTGPPPPAFAADDTLELPSDEVRARLAAITAELSAAKAAAVGVDASLEPGWTPFQPEVDREPMLPPIKPSPIVELNAESPSNGERHDRLGGVDPRGTVLDAHEVHNSSPPISEDIPVDMDLSAMGSIPDASSDELATYPRLPHALDSEEIRIDEADRVSETGEVEVAPEDLVSVESLPSPALNPPPVKTAGKYPAFRAPEAATATSLMAGAPPGARSPAVATSQGVTPVAPSVTTTPHAPAVSPAAHMPPVMQAGATPVAPSSPGIAARRPSNPLVFVPPVGALAPPPMTDTAANRKKTRPWWEELFNDDFIRTMAKVTDTQIGKEVNFIEESLGCEAGAMILDLACGTGRHAVELAARGYQVVGFDLSLAMLARASDEAQDRKQKINFVQGDMREMTFEETFDGVYSWNTSFGYFDEEKNSSVIARVHKALKKGGQFLLDVVNRDYIVRQAPSLAWFEGDGCICMDEMTIDFITSRMKVKRTLMMDDGRTKEIEYSIRTYALHELGKMLHDNGFRVAEVSGRTGTPGVFFGCESPRTLILAEKR